MISSGQNARSKLKALHRRRYRKAIFRNKIAASIQMARVDYQEYCRQYEGYLCKSFAIYRNQAQGLQNL